jgi:APA family basic amino acid/polyamine antiporter
MNPAPAPQGEQGASPGGLLKVLGLAFGLAVVVGDVIGMGILRTPGEVARHLPSVAPFLVAWIAGACYALLGAMTMSELGAMLPRAGGQYALVREALGPLPGFLVGWTDWVSTTGSSAAVALVIGEYSGPLLPGMVGHGPAIAAVLMLAVTVVQARGIRTGDAVQRWSSLLKVIALGLVLVVALVVTLGHGGAAPAMTRPGAGATAAITGIGIVAALQAVIFTYDGWTAPIYMSEEFSDPGHDIPRAMIGGILLVLTVYLALNVAFLLVIPLPEMAGDPFVAATAAGRLLGPAGDTGLRIVMIVSLIAFLNANQLIASRVPYAMARDGLFPHRMTSVNPGGTPLPALLLTTLVGLGFLYTNTVDTALAILAFCFVLNYALSFTSLFVMRRREPDRPRPFRVPFYPVVPALALVGSLSFLIAALLTDRRNSLWALGLLAVSAPVYFLRRR